MAAGKEFDWTEKLFDVGLGGLPGAAKALVPRGLKRKALARFEDVSGLRAISPNHDLVRATRLAWIKAALMTMAQARELAGSREWSSEAHEAARFHDLAEPLLRDERSHAIDMDQPLRACPIDRDVQAILDGVPELIAPGDDGSQGRGVTQGFVVVLAELSGWPAIEVPAVFGQVAQAGLATGGGAARSFGELVFAAFAEIIKSPTEYPEAREAFHIAMGKVTRDLGQATLGFVRTLDEKLDRLTAGLDAERLMREGAAEYLALLPAIAEDAAAGRRAAESADRKLDEVIRRLAAEKEVPEAPLREVLALLGAEEVPRDEIPARLRQAAAELLSLRQDLARLRNDRPELAAIRAKALAHLDAGRLDEARATIREGREAAKALRQEISRDEARFLVDEARLDKLQLDYTAACDKLSEAGRLAPDEVWTWIELGDLWLIRGDISAAETAYREAHTTLARNGDERSLFVCLSRISDVMLMRGDLSAALSSYEQVLAISRRLAEAEPSNTLAADDLSVSLNKFGDAKRESGDLTSALASFQDSLGIRRRLSEADPSNTNAARDLAVCFAKIGDVQHELGDLTGALLNYQRSLDVLRRLVDADRSSARAASDLAITLSKFGNVQRERGDIAGALASYQEDLSISQRLADTDRFNAQAARNLFISLVNIGDAQRQLVNLSSALASYQQGLIISRRLADADRSSAQAARDLSVNLTRVGDIQRQRGDLTDALASYQDGLDVFRRLAAADQINAQAARDISASLDKVGDVKRECGDLAGALASYEESIVIRRRLVAVDPSSALAARDLSVGLEKIGDVQREQGEITDALASHQEGLAIRRQLAAADPSSAQAARDLSVSLDRLGMTEKAAGQINQACKCFREGRAVLEEFRERSGFQDLFRDDLAEFEQQLRDCPPAG